MEKRELICIGCPLGCMISVELEGKEVKNVTGNTCPRGKVYAEKVHKKYLLLQRIG